MFLFVCYISLTQTKGKLSCSVLSTLPNIIDNLSTVILILDLICHKISSVQSVHYIPRLNKKKYMKSKQNKGKIIISHITRKNVVLCALQCLSMFAIDPAIDDELLSSIFLLWKVPLFVAEPLDNIWTSYLRRDGINVKQLVSRVVRFCAIQQEVIKHGVL